MRRMLMLGLLVVQGWAGACDFAPNFHDALQWEFKKEFGSCPAIQSLSNQHCLTLKEKPPQILKRLPEYANWPGANRYTWDYGDPMQGQIYNHYHLSIRPLKTGSLVLLREETGPIVALSQNLGRLFENTFPNSAQSGICFIPSDLKAVIKSCQAIKIARENTNLPALQLTFYKSIGKKVEAGKTYVYYRSNICSITQFESIP